jgi:NADH dehydrogenase
MDSNRHQAASKQSNDARLEGVKEAQQGRPKSIVVVGGGTAGLQLASRLGNRLGKPGLANIVLVDRNSTHLWKPLLHEVATGRVESVTHDTVFALQGKRNHFRFVQGELVAVDRTQRTITLALPEAGEVQGMHRTTIAYDELVLAIGGVTQYFGVPGAQQYALTLDTVSSAEQVRQRVASALRRKVFAQPREDGAPVRLAIVGAGATGVQLAAHLRRRIATVLDRHGAWLDPVTGVDISLIEGSPRILSGMDARIAEGVQAELAAMKIRVVTQARVTRVHESGLVIAGQALLPTDVVVWTAGVAAPAVLATLGLPVNPNGRIRVRETLQSVTDDRIFAIGDCASCRLQDLETDLPPRAQVAHQQALYLAGAIVNRMRGQAVTGFSYRDYGSVVSLAGSKAIGRLEVRGGRGWNVAGKFGALVHLAVYRRHIVALHGWGRALLVMAFQRLGRVVGK